MTPSDLESALKAHVEILCESERNTGNCPGGLERSAEYIGGQFQRLGYGVTRQEFPAAGVVCANIEAVPPGFVGCDHPHIIIGAHYDSAPGTPGAGDNASAVAILLEVARLLAGRPGTQLLRFLAYTNEEPPHFYTATMGSVVHARSCRKRGDKITGMICLESLGIFHSEPGSQELPAEFELLPDDFKKMIVPPGIDPTIGNFLAVIGNPASAAFLGDFVGKLANDQPLPMFATEILDIRLSDHLAYWEEGYPAIMLTDTALYRNAHYHLPSDTPEKLKYPLMALLAERIAAAVEELTE